MLSPYPSIFFVIILILTSCNTQKPTAAKENNAPVARFSITPTIGDTTTIFEFDATGSTDVEDPLSSLAMRWDWDNDDIWDTDYFPVDKLSRTFSDTGKHLITLEIKDSEGLSDTVKHALNITEPNSPPRSSFSISITRGTTSTRFRVDASDSWDDQDSTQLMYRWDWESDGFWDTEYSISDTSSHVYSSEGSFFITLEVKDSGGLTDTTRKSITVSNVPLADSTLTDIDGNVYPIIKIGNQYWLGENLRVTRFINGDSIPKVRDNNAWASTKESAYCNYLNQSKYTRKGGYLYNWYTIKDERQIAPKGWRIPTESDWDELINFYGGREAAAKEMKKSDGFNAYNIGYRFKNGDFQNVRYFWIGYCQYCGEKAIELLSSADVRVMDPTSGVSIRLIKE